MIVHTSVNNLSRLHRTYAPIYIAKYGHLEMFSKRGLVVKTCGKVKKGWPHWYWVSKKSKTGSTCQVPVHKVDGKWIVSTRLT